MSTKHMPNRHSVVKKTKIAVIGMLPNQQQNLLERLSSLASFNFIDKNRKSKIDLDGQDFVIIMANFVSHSIVCQAKNSGCGKLIVHYGGIEKLISKLNEILIQN
jgi:hypothetical protein